MPDTEVLHARAYASQALGGLDCINIISAVKRKDDSLVSAQAWPRSARVSRETISSNPNTSAAAIPG